MKCNQHSPASWTYFWNEVLIQLGILIPCSAPTWSMTGDLQHHQLLQIIMRADAERPCRDTHLAFLALVTVQDAYLRSRFVVPVPNRRIPGWTYGSRGYCEGIIESLRVFSPRSSGALEFLTPEGEIARFEPETIPPLWAIPLEDSSESLKTSLSTDFKGVSTGAVDTLPPGNNSKFSGLQRVLPVHSPYYDDDPSMCVPI